MKALRFHASKDLRVEDVDGPKACGPHEVLLKKLLLRDLRDRPPRVLARSDSDTAKASPLFESGSSFDSGP